MSSNKFEKQVQENLEELQFTPSDAVWQNVEKELRKDKKRRRWFLLPLLLLCIGAGGYFAYHNSNSHTNSIQKNTPISVPATPYKEEAVTSDKQHDNAFSEKYKNDDKAGNQAIVLDNSEANGTASLMPSTNNKASRVVANNTDNKHDISVTLADKKDKTNFKKIKRVNSDLVTSIAQPEKQAKTNEIKAKAGKVKDEDDRAVITSKNKTEEVAFVTNDATPPTEKERAVKDTDELIDLNDDLIKKDTTQTKSKIDTIASNIPNAPVVAKSVSKESKKSKWKWYGDIALGLSNLNTSFAPLGALGISSENKSADNRNFFNSGGNPIAVGNNLSVPSTSKPGFSFRAGITADRKISKRSSLSIGLQYAYYSNVGIAGQVADTAIINAGLQNLNIADSRAVYVSGPANKNGNQYHFLQIPVSFTTLIGKSKRLPWYWSTGFSLNYLITSNALVYNNTTRVFNQNKDLFRPIQFGWHTGIEAEFFSKKQHPLRLGPQFNFNLSPLLKNVGSKNQVNGSIGKGTQDQRFTYIGIKASMLLNKK
jgi:hypothetical protein